ncbi:MAG: co-chaperone GroES [Vulcanimicrobiota bacterium]
MTTQTLKVKPLGDRVILKPIQQEDKTKGGVILPDSAKEKPQQGEVVATGTGRILDNGTKVDMEVKVGDKVLYGKYTGTEIKIEGEEYLIVKESEILGIVS